MPIFKFIILGLFSTVLTSCSVTKKFWPLSTNDDGIAKDKQQQRKAFKEASQLKMQNKWVKSLEAFQEMERLYPNSIFTPSIKFQIAEIYKEQKNCQAAISYYKKAISLWQSRNIQDTVKTRYMMSQCLEMLGEDHKSVAILIQYQNSRYLSKEIRKVEIPARLATSYARLNNNVEARKYYLEAERGLKQLLRRQQKKLSSDWLAQTLFQVGRVAIQDSKDRSFEAELRALVIGQGYVYRAIELNDEKWSPKALKELLEKYSVLEGRLDQLAPHPNFGVIARRKQQAEQIEKAMDLRVAIHKLKLEAIPLEKRNKLQTELYSKLALLDAGLDKIIFAKQIGQGVEGEFDFSNLKYPGRVIDDFGRLEKRKAKIPERLPVRPEERAIEKTPLKKAVEIPFEGSKDPNL